MFDIIIIIWITIVYADSTPKNQQWKTINDVFKQIIETKQVIELTNHAFLGYRSRYENENGPIKFSYLWTNVQNSKMIKTKIVDIIANNTGSVRNSKSTKFQNILTSSFWQNLYWLKPVPKTAKTVKIGNQDCKKRMA